MAARDTGEARKRLSGPETAPYMGLARKLMGELKEFMAFNRLSQLSWTKDFSEGVRITVSSVFGVDEIRIRTTNLENPQSSNPRRSRVKSTGLVMAGNYFVPDHIPNPTLLTNRFFVWTKAGGIEDIGMLPGCTDGSMIAMSRDGKTVVGWCGGTDTYAARWTRKGGMQALGIKGYATSVNSDGSVIVGFTWDSSFKYHPFTWTEKTGAVVDGRFNLWLRTQQSGPRISPNGNLIAIPSGTSRTTLTPVVLDKNGNSIWTGDKTFDPVTMTDGGKLLLQDAYNTTFSIADVAKGTQQKIPFYWATAMDVEAKVVTGGFDYQGDAYYWTDKTGAVILPPFQQAYTSSSANCVSDDGKFIGGSIALPDHLDNHAPNNTAGFWEIGASGAAMTRFNTVQFYGGSIDYGGSVAAIAQPVIELENG